MTTNSRTSKLHLLPCSDTHKVAALLPVASYRFHCRASKTINLPEYAGSTWRGVFGHALKQSACSTKEPECKNCLLYRSCTYSYLFETPPPENSELMRKYPSAPHPYIFHAGRGTRQLNAGDSFSVDMNLFGRATSSLPYVVHAMRSAGQRGLGKGRGKYQLERVDQLLGMACGKIYQSGGSLLAHKPVILSIPPCPNRVLLELLTPLRVLRDGNQVSPQKLAFRDLFANLLRRQSMLCYFHGSGVLEEDFAQLVEASEGISLTSASLRWQHWDRYSSRQECSQWMGGIVGSFLLESPNLSAFWPYLWLGQWTHAGRGSTMGMGQYRLLPQWCSE